MLIGDIPSRTIFSHGPYRQYLFPYYELVQSLVKGDIQVYERIKNKYTTLFQKDGLFVLINRLHQNVIRSGLKKINLSYSKISFEDIRIKLNLPQELDISLIVAKGIKDKVISGFIDTVEKVLVIQECKDIYSTAEPQVNFQKRINYCINLHDSAVKALMYPTEKDKGEEKENDENDLDNILILDDDFLF